MPTTEGSFTDAETTDIRRFCGYPAYAAYGYVFDADYAKLDTQIGAMAPAEIAIVRTVYLSVLTGLESAILTSAMNIGTDIAAVWTRNRTEREDRTALFNQKRRDLCAFIGVPPGAGLRSGTQLVRT